MIGIAQIIKSQRLHLGNRQPAEKRGRRPRKRQREPVQPLARRVGSPTPANPAEPHHQSGQKAQAATPWKRTPFPGRAKYPAAHALAETRGHHQDQLNSPRAPQELDHQASFDSPKARLVCHIPRRLTYQIPCPLPAFPADSSGVYQSSSVRCTPDTQRGRLPHKPPASQLGHRQTPATDCAAPRR